MKPEKQVVSLELAQKLKSLGVKQNGYFCWVNYGNKVEEWEVKIDDGGWVVGCPSAFTVAELWNILPKFIDLFEDHPLTMKKNYSDNRTSIGYRDDARMLFEINPADALAEMLIYLLENNLITL